MSKHKIANSVRFLSFPIAAFLMMFPHFAAARQSDSKPTYEVYAISYAVIPDFPVASLVAGADKSRKLDIQMMVWLLKGSNGRNVLVDSGFYRDKFFKQWKVKDFVKPSEAIAKVGLKPEDITDIIITHMHWDHADGIDLFPKANVWIQRDEYAYYTGEAWHAKTTHGGIDPDDVAALVRLNIEGRVRFVNGDDQEAIEGIRFFTGGKHTFASQYVAVNTKGGAVVLASDNLYLYENLDKRAPIAQTLDKDSNLRAQDRMKQIASKPELIIPGHDPEVFVRFPKPGNGVARIR
ncbi:MAG TPA: N-acyl homoserine lactonase family protein [Blastocatellia bacterium]|nr:N-acyl homoserine lactonase family protein [Blastocatellia bacterium]